MTRPSGNIDSLLLQTGEQLILETGFDNFSIREVCKKANVNLGMFHYLFKSKENFISLIFTNFIKKYDDIQQKYLIENEDKRAIDKIKGLLFIRAKFVKANKEIFLMVLKDSFIVKFKDIIRDYNFIQFEMFEKLITQAQSQGDISDKVSVIYAMPMLLSPVQLMSLADKESIGKYNGFIKNSDEDDKKIKFEDYIKNLIELILGGLK